MRHYRRPRRGEEVRVLGRTGKVIRADYLEGTVRIRFTDKRGGIKALELDEFEDNWTGRRWEIPDERLDGEDTDRLDVQILFDFCYCNNDSDYFNDQLVVRKHQLEGEERMTRLRFLIKYLPEDDPRRLIMEMMNE